jgi:hypothetical protein
MIISASSRTDIPAFYGEWFARRIAAGYCVTRNPFGGAHYRIGLRREEVDAFVFWTKDLGPFLPQLAMAHERGYPFIVQYTVNNYPRPFEHSAARPDRAVERIKAVARAFGAGRCVWRYDPIVIGDGVGFDWHRCNFAALAKGFAGVVDEVAVSFVQRYRKMAAKLEGETRRSGIRFADPSDDEKRQFFRELTAIAADCGVTLKVCAQAHLLSPGVAEASCIDVVRLSAIAGAPIAGVKPGHRGEECACSYSRDIGAYDTCLHGCLYCYAVSSPRAAALNRRRHDPQAEMLLGSGDGEAQRTAIDDLPLFCRNHVAERG